MAEAKVGPIINPNTKLRFIREDRVELPSIADNGFGDDWRLAAQFLKEFANSQLETYPYYNPEFPRTKDILTQDAKSGAVVDTIPHLIAMEPMALLTNLDNEQLSVVLQALQHLGIALNRREKMGWAKLAIQGMLLGRLTAK